MRITIADTGAEARLAAANYIVMAKTAERALRNAQEVLVVRRAGFADLDETRAINAALPEIVANRAAIEAELDAFLALSAAIQPPTEVDVRNAQQLAEQLDTMNARSSNATRVIAAAQQVAGLWAATRVVT